MDLKTYINDLKPEPREDLAEKCATTLGHLKNVMYGLRPCAPELAVLLEQATKGAVTRQDLRPDDWRRIWPELIKPKRKQQEA